MRHDRRHWISKMGGSILLASFLTFLGTQAFGQNRSAGEIRGTVTDSSGAVVPGAVVTVTNTATGVTHRTTTGGAGFYDAPSLLPGEYRIVFSKEGFKEYVRSGIVLHVETITVNAAMQLGSLSQSVTVQGAAPLVQTDTSDVKERVTDQAITEMPNVNREWFYLTGLLPGGNPGTQGQEIGGPSTGGGNVGLNGAPSYESNWLVDGGADTMPAGQNPDILVVPIEDIAEVDMITSNASAEFGNGLSVFNVITKSGTNQWHGSVFEFVQNDKLNARNFFAQTRTPLRWNEFGGTFGGPIKRDKAFFFFSYQRNPTDTWSPTFYTYPTQAMRGGDFSAPGLPTVYDPSTLTLINGNWVRTAFLGNQVPLNRIDPVAAKIQNYFPVPNLPGVFNNYYYVARSPLRTTYYNGKGDYNISSSNRLTGSLMIVSQGGVQGSLAPDCPIDCTNVSTLESQSEITDVWTISPTIVNEFRSSEARERDFFSAAGDENGFPAQIGLKNPAVNAFPTITIEGAVPTSLATSQIGGSINAYTTYVQADSLTFVKGKHILKFGGEFDKWQQNTNWQVLSPGNFDFSGIFSRNPSDPSSSGLDYADFLVGLPDTWSVDRVPLAGGRVWNLQLFAQDSYKVTPKLTLNGGLRYQIQTGWTEAHNRLSSFDPTLTNPATGTPGAIWFAGQNGRHALQQTIPDVLSPRFGFAWTPKSTWSVRGAYGIFPTMWGGGTYYVSAGGWSIQGFETSTDLIHPIFSLAQGPPLPVYPSAATRTPDSLNGQQVSYFPYDTPAAYVQEWNFDIQHEFAGGVLLDGAYVGTRGVHLGFGRDINQVPPDLLGPGDAQQRRPYPQFAGISASLFDGISAYNSFQFSAKKRFSRGLTFGASYTLSKAMDTGTASGWGGLQNVDVWQNAYDPHANYGLTKTDIPQLLNGYTVYELPFGAGKALLNHGGIANGVLGGWQLSAMWQLHSGLPFTPVMGTADLSGSLAGTWLPNRLGQGTLANPSINGWFNPTAFAQPAPYTFGNSGRDILRGPAWENLNFALAKNFKIRWLGEAGRLQVRAEAYDALNNPNFGMPDPNIGTSGVGVISSANTNRLIQLGAKLSF